MTDRTEKRPLLAGLAALALALACLGAAEAHQGEAAARPAAAPLSVKPLRTSQSAILPEGSLELRLRSRIPGLVRIVPRLRSGSNGTVRVGKKRRVRLRAGRGRSVVLSLSSAGRPLIARCEPADLLFKAKLRPSGAAESSAGR